MGALSDIDTNGDTQHNIHRKPLAESVLVGTLLEVLPNHSLWTQSPQLSSHHRLCQLCIVYTPGDTVLASDVLEHYKNV